MIKTTKNLEAVLRDTGIYRDQKGVFCGLVCPKTARDGCNSFLVEFLDSTDHWLKDIINTDS